MLSKENCFLFWQANVPLFYMYTVFQGITVPEQTATFVASQWNGSWSDFFSPTQSSLKKTSYKKRKIKNYNYNDFYLYDLSPNNNKSSVLDF